jgi:hypothetical protein
VQLQQQLQHAQNLEAIGQLTGGEGHIEVDLRSSTLAGEVCDLYFTTKEVGKGSGMDLAMVMGLLPVNRRPKIVRVQRRFPG